MVNGSPSCSNKKDWFELYNLGSDHLVLDGCELSDDNDSTYSVKGPLVLGPGEYVAMVQASSDCDFDAPYHYCYGGSPNLNTGNDSISLVCDGVGVFDVHYDSKDQAELPAPDDVNGTPASVQVNPGRGQMSAGYILNPDNWFPACTAMSCGDLGSPGEANPACN